MIATLENENASEPRRMQALIICLGIIVSTPHPATAVTARIVLFGKRSTKLSGAVATLSRKGRGKGENDKSLRRMLRTQA